MTEDNKTVVKRSYTKKEKYEKEQMEVVARLNQILGLDEKNDKIVWEQLKNDKDKLNKIIELEEDVKKYFAYGNWAYFKGNIIEETKGICLARAIYKASGYEVNYKQKRKNGEKYTEYSFTKKKSLG